MSTPVQIKSDGSAVQIKSDGSAMGTSVTVGGVKLTNIKSMRLEGDCQGGLLHLTLWLFDAQIDIDGIVKVDDGIEPTSMPGPGEPR